MLLECSCIYKGHRDIVFIGEEKGESQREGEGGREKEGKRERESILLFLLSLVKSSYILESQYYTYLRKSPPWRRGIVFVVIQYEIIFFSVASSLLFSEKSLHCVLFTFACTVRGSCHCQERNFCWHYFGYAYKLTYPCVPL